jgi:hypothetical protein
MIITINTETGQINVATIDSVTNFPQQPIKKLSTVDNALSPAEKTKLTETITLITTKAHT